MVLMQKKQKNPSRWRVFIKNPIKKNYSTLTICLVMHILALLGDDLLATLLLYELHLNIRLRPSWSLVTKKTILASIKYLKYS